MRLLRGMGRLRLVSMLLFVVAMVYAVGVLRSSYSLDNINSDSRAGESDKGGLSLRRVKSSYHDDDNDLVYYKKDVPLIWVGGVPRSGTTLMRVLLDAHRDVRCGEETRVIPRLLSMHSLMMKSRKEVDRLTHAKITEGVLDNAQAAYILSIISEHGEKALRLCNKDPFALKSMSKILKMFPQSKFIFMIRDGRATVHSIISRHVTIKGFNIESYRGALQDWNRAIEFMHNECKSVGPQACLPVFYEQLVLHPQSQMRNILTFLDLDWDDMVLHHEKTINKTGGASVSGIELSTDQVERPINTEALTSWVSFIPADVRKDMRKIAPMLQVLGYDPDAYPPNYGEPDDIVKEADLHLKQDNKFYQERKPKHPVLPPLGPLRLYINSKTPTSSINATKSSPPKH